MKASCPTFRVLAMSACCVLLMFSAVRAAEEAKAPAALQTVKYQVTGLFSADRAQDLRHVVQEMEGVTLVSVDYQQAESMFVFDPAQLFPKAKTPEEILAGFHEMLGLASRRTFGVKPVCEVPREQLQWVKIPVGGLDCKGCSLAAYDAIYKLEGVEQATASFKAGLVTAWIHPDKTNQGALEAALESKHVALVKKELAKKEDDKKE